eukprot:5128184-Prymnesium_polylepis.1
MALAARWGAWRRADGRRVPRGGARGITTASGTPVGRLDDMRRSVGRRRVRAGWLAAFAGLRCAWSTTHRPPLGRGCRCPAARMAC